MTRRFIKARAILALAGLLSALSCDSSGPVSGNVQSPPAHPAMSAPVSKTGSGHSHSPPAGLPAGHPPVAPSGPSPEGGPSAELAGSCVERLSELGLVCKLPQGWQEEPPSNQMRLGQARLQRVAADTEDGEVSISPAMGTVDANVKRWSEQFVEKPQATLTESKAGALQATIVELEGTFTGGGGPMMKTSGAPRSGTKLIGVIVSVPGAQQMIFFKAWGPRATMERWRPSFDELVASFQGAR